MLRLVVSWCLLGNEGPDLFVVELELGSCLLCADKDDNGCESGLGHAIQQKSLFWLKLAMVIGRH